MSQVRKGRPTRKPSQTRKWIAAFSVFLLLTIIIATAHLWFPSGSNNVANQSYLPTQTAAFTAYVNHYLAIMKNLNSTEIKTEMAALLSPNYNQTDLFTWEHSKLTFAQDPNGWYEDPFQILNSGDGICVQWSILYVSACLALGYQSRLVVAANTSTWTFIHAWAEDYYNGKWVHVDPSDGVWNDPSRYQTWGWGTFGTQVRVYAFTDGNYQEVTSTYAPQST